VVRKRYLIKNDTKTIPYKLHLLQHMKGTEKSARKVFCIQMQAMLEEYRFDDRLVFSDETIFHVTCKVNKHNADIMGN